MAPAARFLIVVSGMAWSSFIRYAKIFANILVYQAVEKLRLFKNSQIVAPGESPAEA
jgi:hypothetical protein